MPKAWASRFWCAGLLQQWNATIPEAMQNLCTSRTLLHFYEAGQHLIRIRFSLTTSLPALLQKQAHDAITHYARGDTKLILHSFQHGLPLVSITLREPLLREGWRCVYNTYLQATYIGHVPRWPSACFPKLI